MWWKCGVVKFKPVKNIFKHWIFVFQGEWTGQGGGEGRWESRKTVETNRPPVSLNTYFREPTPINFFAHINLRTKRATKTRGGEGLASLQEPSRATRRRIRPAVFSQHQLRQHLSWARIRDQPPLLLLSAQALIHRRAQAAVQPLKLQRAQLRGPSKDPKDLQGLQGPQGPPRTSEGPPRTPKDLRGLQGPTGTSKALELQVDQPILFHLDHLPSWKAFFFLFLSTIINNNTS